MKIGSILAFLCIHASAAISLAGDECPSFKTVNDVLQCAMANHPEVRKALAIREQGMAQVDLARSLLNPELNLEALPSGTGGSTTEITLIQPVELGPKRQLRSAQAQAQVDAESARIEVAREQVATEVYLALMRARQIETELHLLDEAIETAQIVERQYGRLIRLNPEQEVSLSVLRLSEEQHRMQKGELLGERKRLQSNLEAALGRSFSFEERLLPKPKEALSWPKAPGGDLKPVRLLEALAQQRVAAAERELAQAQKWPDVALGPKLEHQGGDQSETRIGVVVSLPLPILNRNQAGVAVAEAGARRAEIEARAIQFSAEKEREVLVDAYDRITSSIKAMRSPADLEIKHERMHRHLARGVIAPTLVIEMHRQIFEFRRNLHERQLQALASLIRLRQIHGMNALESLP